MSIKKSLGLVLVILGFVLIALTGIRTISSPEIFTHLALGQAGGAEVDPISYSLADQEWINLHPLYNKLVFMLWSMGGAGLITLTHVAITLIAFILMFRFGKDWGGPLSQGLALLLCAWLLMPVFNPSPIAFFMLFTALYVTLLYKLKNFNLLAILLIALQVLWTNMHPSFLFGPVLILFFAIENWQETKHASRTSMVTPLTGKLFGLAGASLAVTLINPSAINLHRHIISNWALLSGTEGLEWISLFSSGFPQGYITSLTIFALVLGAGGLITLQKKLPAMITMLALVGAFLTVRSIGALAAFCFLALPFMILSFNAVSEYLTRTLTSAFKANETMLHDAMVIITLILMIATMGSLVTNTAYVNSGSASGFGLGVEDQAFPAAAIGIMEREDFPERILNLSHDGGYIAFMLPGKKVFSDTRTSFYGEDFYKTLTLAMLGRPGAWKTIQNDWNPDAIVLNGAWPDAGALANRLIASRAWKMVYFDGSTILIVKNLPEYQTLIEDSTIQVYGTKVLENSRKKYIAGNMGLIKSPNSSRIIGASGLLLALNRPVEAESLYRVLTRNCPDMAQAWLGLGQSLMLQKKLTKGIAAMERAVDITPSSSRVWMALYQAYRLQGNEAKAQMAAEKLNKFFQAEEATEEQREIANPEKKPAEQPVQSDGMSLPDELK